MTSIMACARRSNERFRATSASKNANVFAVRALDLRFRRQSSRKSRKSFLRALRFIASSEFLFYGKHFPKIIGKCNFIHDVLASCRPNRRYPWRSPWPVRVDPKNKCDEIAALLRVSKTVWCYTLCRIFTKMKRACFVTSLGQHHSLYPDETCHRVARSFTVPGSASYVVPSTPTNAKTRTHTPQKWNTHTYARQRRELCYLHIQPKHHNIHRENMLIHPSVAGEVAPRAGLSWRLKRRCR